MGVLGKACRQPALVERGDELLHFESVIGEIGAGGGTTVVHGPSGIGKSRLLRELRERAAAAGFLTLAVAAGRDEAGISYGVVKTLLERVVHGATAEERQRIFSGAARLSCGLFGDAEGLRAADPATGLDHGLYWLISNLAERQPVLMTIDDAQWADPGSLRFLRYLCRRIDGLPVAVAISLLNGEPLDEPDTWMSSAPQLHHLAPRPLSPAGSEQLLHDLGVAPAMAPAACRLTGGNPFLLKELAVACLAHDVAVDDAAPPSIGHAVQRRLSRLPDGAQKLAEALAVLGSGFDLRQAAEVAQLAPGTAVEAAERLVAASIWVDPGTPGFVHPIVKNVIAAGVPDSGKAALHQRAADVLLSEGADPEVVANHLVGTVPAGRGEVVARLRDAAGLAINRGGVPSAVRLLTRALREPPDRSARGDVLAELASAELLADAAGAALPHITESYQLAMSPCERGTRALILATAHRGVGGIDEAKRVLEEAFELVRDSDRDIGLRLMGELAVLDVYFSAPTRHLQQLLLQAASYPGSSAGERTLLASLALHTLYSAEGTAQAAVSLARRALGTDDLLADLTSANNLFYAPIIALALCDRPHEALMALASAKQDAEARGSALGLSLASCAWSATAWHHGDVTTAEERAEASWLAALEVGPGPNGAMALIVSSRYYSRALRELGELRPAAELFEVVDRHPGMEEIGGARSHLAQARGLLHAAQGEWASAVAELRTAGRIAGADGWDPERPWRSDLAVALAAAGESEEALDYADQHLVGARHWGAASSLGVALRTRALVDRAGPSVDGLADAADVLRPSPARLEYARTKVHLGLAHLRHGDRSAGLAQLSEGHDLAHTCGARALEASARSAMRAAGLRPRRPKYSGADALTPSERRVAELVAAGHTNREAAQLLFVTLKTIEGHLASTFRKLHVSSRTEIAGAIERSSRSTADGCRPVDRCPLCLSTRFPPPRRPGPERSRPERSALSQQ